MPRDQPIPEESPVPTPALASAEAPHGPPSPEAFEAQTTSSPTGVDDATVETEDSEAASPTRLAEESAPEHAQPNEEQTMLDVHAPHEPVHSWKDALVHIAIIVVGLLIAVGLDAAAEHFHHMRQVSETREALRQELEYNIKLFQQTTRDTRWETVEYKNNLLVFEFLQSHPGTPQEKLPGVLAWDHGDDRYRYAAWETAQQSGITALMPQDEVATDSAMYHDLHHAEDMAEEGYSASHQAEEYIFQDYDPSHLAPAEVARELELTRNVLMWHYRYILALRMIEQRDSGFTSGPTAEDERQVQNSPDEQTRKLLAPAIDLTLRRLKAAGYPDQQTSSGH
jgi:hypothetical protein